ncbi:hypothetical protein Tco_0751100 [Tanacetum coccineum]|uniref:Zinc finger, CCHC-type n=1 Tax=Tanacetum coccineum TaxID=301880 RepID=A0ABQ4Z338_9ASTR
MIRPDTVNLLILYWTTYIEYGLSDLRPEAYDGIVAAAQNTNNSTIRCEKKLKFVEQPIRPAPDPKTADLDTIDKYYESIYLEQEEPFETVKAFHACKQEDGQSVSSYLLKMKSYLDILERLGNAMPNELGTIDELHAMLKFHEKGIPKKAETLSVLSTREGKMQKHKK